MDRCDALRLVNDDVWGFYLFASFVCIIMWSCVAVPVFVLVEPCACGIGVIVSQEPSSEASRLAHLSHYFTQSRAGKPYTHTPAPPNPAPGKKIEGRRNSVPPEQAVLSTHYETDQHIKPLTTP